MLRSIANRLFKNAAEVPSGKPPARHFKPLENKRLDYKRQAAQGRANPFQPNRKFPKINKPSTAKFQSSSAEALRTLGVSSNSHIAILAALGVGLSAVLMYMSKKSTKKPVIDKSLLSTGKATGFVIGATECHSAATATSTGRSGAHKVKRTDPITGKVEYFYYKETFDRKGLLNELIGGALGRELFGEKFPRVFLHETPLNDLQDQSRYALLSESIADPNINMEDWSLNYSADNASNMPLPRHLGSVLAFDKMLGKTDCKLANLVTDHGDNNCGDSYSIDQETAFNQSPSFIEDPQTALSFILEFVEKSIIDYSHEENCDTLDTNNNVDQPLKANFAVKDAVRPVFLKMIEDDMTNGNVYSFYAKFANLSSERVISIVKQFGLLTNDEQVHYYDSIMLRIAASKMFVSDLKAAAAHTAVPEVSEPEVSSLSPRRM